MGIFTRLLLFAFCLSSANLHGANLVIASDDAPPHMIARTNSGIDLDIVSQVLTSLGYNLSYTYAPLHRAKQMVISGKADVIVPTFYQQDNEQLYFSAPIIDYKPTIFSRRKDSLNINDFNDLAHYSVISFQGATGYFGQAYEQAVSKTNYRELHDMSKFPALLLSKRTDIVVLDYYIFYYYLNTIIGNEGDTGVMSRHQATNYLIQSHPLIPPVSAYAAFYSKALRDEFNRALAQFINTKQYEKIINSYLFSTRPDIQTLK
ncbi:substrate-binding periplasmic protein [Thalassotalea euphylliae]|nr:transporter substrate-binding domain-containing protein [Thalassotalea euphylliae]